MLAVLLGMLLLTSPVLAVDASREGEIRRTVKEEVKRELKEERKEATKGAKEAIKNRVARVSGATVTAVSADSLTISKDGTSATVDVLATTKLRRKFWGNATISEFSVSDVVDVLGMWTDETHTTINANLIRNRSVQKRHGVFVGTVTSLSSSGWVMNTFNRGPQTVTVLETTKFGDRTGKMLTQTDVAVGHMVRVRGLWNSKMSTITEVTAVKDYSLPVKLTPKTATSSASE